MNVEIINGKFENPEKKIVVVQKSLNATQSSINKFHGTMYAPSRAQEEPQNHLFRTGGWARKC
jgi:hypothetical protein